MDIHIQPETAAPPAAAGALLPLGELTPRTAPRGLPAWFEHFDRSNQACYALDMMGKDNLEKALRTLGAVLESRGVSSRILVAGGSSLLLLGLIDRPTADLDVIGLATGDRYVKAETLPAPLAEAAREVGAALGLADNWLNTGPASLFDFGLPEGYEQRVSVHQYGSLEVHVPGRVDLLAFKLYAAVDHSGARESKHLNDLKDMQPTPDELLTAARWTRTHDPSDGYKGELVKVLASLNVEALDHDL